MRKNFLTLFLMMNSLGMQAQELYSQAMAESQAKSWTQRPKWDYVSGLVTKSLLKICEQYPGAAGTDSLYQWSKAYTDLALNEDGSFKDFKKGNIDNIASGKILFEVYRHEAALDQKNGTQNAERYKKAANWLHKYLVLEYPRIKGKGANGAFFHKAIYPNQMWLDGLYMGAAFYAEWVSINDPKNMAAWSDIAQQFIYVNQHTYNPITGLNYHAWSATPEDENSFWARKEGPFRGCSPEFWGRGMGWFFAALVDVLEYMPKEHEDYSKLEAITNQVASGLKSWQDEKSGCWYQLLQYNDSFISQCGAANYLESSASSMFTYAYLKGIRLGILPREEYLPTALKAYQGLLDTFITKNEDGSININQSCRSAGLGPAKDPARDGTADYYLCGPDIAKVNNEGKAIGPFIMASLEYELHQEAAKQPAGKTTTSNTKKRK